MGRKRWKFLLVGLVCFALMAANMILETGSAEKPSGQKKPPLPKSWKLLFVRYGDIWIANGDGTGQRLLIKNGCKPCWSPDRRHIAFFRDGDLWIANADGTNQRKLTSFPPPSSDWDWLLLDRSLGVSWDPKVKRITFSRLEKFWVTPVGSKKGEIVYGSSIFDLLLNSPRREMRIHFDIYNGDAFYQFAWHSAPAWSPSGKYLAFVRNGDIWIAYRGDEFEERSPLIRPGAHRTWEWDVTRLLAAAEFDAPTYRSSRENYGVTCLSWSPDEKRLAYSIRRLTGSGFWEVRVLELDEDWSFAERESIVKKQWKIDDGEDPCFSPDGRFIVYWAVEGVLRVATVDGKQRWDLIEDGDEPAW